MGRRKTLAIAVMILGALLLLLSNYIAKQVAAGRVEIAHGQQKVNQVNSLFSVSKYTQPVGKELTKSGQRKINAGAAEADQYERIARQLQIGGVIVIAIGAALFFFWKKKR